MSHTFLMIVLVSPLLAAIAPAQVPPKYEIVTIDDDPAYDYIARMNNRGQIVYETWKVGGDTNSTEIVLWNNGSLVQITDDDVYDRTPDINDAGQIVWARAVDGPGTAPQIVLWQDAVLTQLTYSAYDMVMPRMNELGHVVWTGLVGDGCAGKRMDLFFYDGSSLQRLTTTGETDNLAHQVAAISDRDEIVWTEYDFCKVPWTSRILVWRNGVLTQVSPPWQTSPQGARINNRGWLAWNENGIYVLDDWGLTMVTDWGHAVGITDTGEIGLTRYYPGQPVGSYEVWLYRSGQFFQITDSEEGAGWDSLWNLPTDINELSEIVYISSRPWYYEATIHALRLRSEAPNTPLAVDVEACGVLTP